MNIIGWRVWCDDGVIYSSRSHTWADVPDVGVQFVWIYHAPPYRTSMHGDDEYRIPGERGVKLGRWMRDEEYAALLAAAKADEDWP